MTAMTTNATNMTYRTYTTYTTYPARLSGGACRFAGGSRSRAVENSLRSTVFCSTRDATSKDVGGSYSTGPRSATVKDVGGQPFARTAGSILPGK